MLNRIHPTSWRPGAGRRGAQRGASLLEVLVAAALLAIGLLSMAWLHAASIRHDKMAQFRGAAVQLANGLADRMRANVDQAGDYARLKTYAPDTASTIETDCAARVCTAAQVAAYDLATYRNAARSLLPGGDLMVDLSGTGRAVIWLLWRDPEVLDTATGAASLAGRCPQGIGTADPAPQCLPIPVLL